MQISIKERFDLRIKSNDLKLLMMIGPVRSIVLESKKHDVAGKDANEINRLQYMCESIFFFTGRDGPKDNCVCQGVLVEARRVSNW